jgi:hypothetical protein
MTRLLRIPWLALKVAYYWFKLVLANSGAG